MIDRLAEDNRRARQLAMGLARLAGLHVDLDSVQTNIVPIDTLAPTADALLPRLATRGVLGFRRSDSRFRFVTHRRSATRTSRARSTPSPSRSDPVLPFLIRRLALLLLVLLGLSALTFGLSHLVPTDPARAALGFDAAPDMVQQYRREMGLDRPLPVQYALYLRNLVRGDLGVSIMTRRSVVEDLAKFLPPTVELTLVSLLLSVTVGGALGVLAAVRRGGPSTCSPPPGRWPSFPSPSS